MSWLMTLQRWDERLTRGLHVPPGHPLRPVVVVGAHLGDGPLWLLIWLGLLAYMYRTQGNVRAVLLWIGSAVLGAMITYAIKFTVKRRRPQEIKGFYSRKYDAHAFPSGHATRMGTVAFWGVILFPHWGWILVGISVWCILSRVALGVHYLGDVVVGFLIGLFASVLLWRVAG
ncbi:MAG: phosphatase PAP2 family protein [Chloroflexi bacterium]|nr:phosphatase PAP2 family protein [Chloroflexota bacterium]